MLCELIETLDFKRQMRQVGLHLHRAAAGEIGDFNLLLALWRFQKNQFRSARRFVPAQLFQAKHVFVKPDRSFQIVDPIPRV